MKEETLKEFIDKVWFMFLAFTPFGLLGVSALAIAGHITNSTHIPFTTSWNEEMQKLM